MAELETPAIAGTIAVPAASTQERGPRRAQLVDDEPSQESGAIDSRDRAVLSAAARARLRQQPATHDPAVEDPQALAETTTDEVRQSIQAAAAVHTAAVFRAARLIR